MSTGCGKNIYTYISYQPRRDSLKLMLCAFRESRDASPRMARVDHGLEARAALGETVKSRKAIVADHYDLHKRERSEQAMTLHS